MVSISVLTACGLEGMDCVLPVAGGGPVALGGVAGKTENAD